MDLGETIEGCGVGVRVGKHEELRVATLHGCKPDPQSVEAIIVFPKNEGEKSPRCVQSLCRHFRMQI